MLDDLFRPYVVRKVQRATLSLFGVTYFSRVLDDRDLHGQEVLVGYDIRDAGRVWVRDSDERFVCIAERDAHASAYFPKSQIERAQERRNRGRKARLEGQLAEVAAERGGGARRLEAPVAEPLSAAAEAMANEQLAILTRVSPPRPEFEARPIFPDDLSWAEWLAAHPEQASFEDRTALLAALRQPEFKRLIEVSGVDRQALTRLTSDIRQIA